MAVQRTNSSSSSRLSSEFSGPSSSNASPRNMDSPTSPHAADDHKSVRQVPLKLASAAETHGKLTAAELLLLLSPSIASSANLASAGGPYSCKLCQAKFPSLHALGYHQAHHRKLSASSKALAASTLPSSNPGRGRKRTLQQDPAEETKAPAPSSKASFQKPEHRSRAPKSQRTAPSSVIVVKGVSSPPFRLGPSAAERMTAASTMEALLTPRVQGVDGPSPSMHQEFPVRPTPSRASPPGLRQPSHLAAITERVMAHRQPEAGAAQPRPACAPLVLPGGGSAVVLERRLSGGSVVLSEAGTDPSCYPSPTTPSTVLPLSPLSCFGHTAPQAGFEQQALLQQLHQLLEQQKQQREQREQQAAAASLVQRLKQQAQAQQATMQQQQLPAPAGTSEALSRLISLLSSLTASTNGQSKAPVTGSDAGAAYANTETEEVFAHVHPTPLLGGCAELDLELRL